MPSTLILLLLLLLPLTIFADFSKGDCKNCVEQGCTYCKGEDFFDNPSVCVCEEFTGFFASCSDHTFGGHPLTSKLDCTFNSTQGEVILAVIVIVSIVVALCLGCCFFCNPFKEGGFCENCCRYEPRSGGSNPAYRTGNSTHAYTTNVTHAFPIVAGDAIPTTTNEAYASSTPGDTTNWSAPPAYAPSDPSPSAPPGDCGDGNGGGTSTFDQLSSGI